MKKIKDTLKRTFRQSYRNILKITPAKVVFNIENLRGYNKLPNFNNPIYFGEKIQCLKLYGNLDRYSQYVDKYSVRNIIKEKIGEEYLIPILGVYNNPEEIDFNSLPNKFVLKVNHGAGYNIICNNKSELNIYKTKKKLEQWLKEDYSKIKKEYQYKNVERKIVCEKFINDKNGELLDYKFFCFNGKVEFIKVDIDRFKGHAVNIYDCDWNLLDMREGEFPNSDRKIKKPENLEQMIQIANRLASDFNFVRIDLYNVDGKIYFGEITLTPAGGLNPFYPLEKDIEYAGMIDLSIGK